MNGFKRALRQAGLEIPAGYLQETTFDRAGGYGKTRILLRMVPRPTAILACNDMIALGCYHALTDSGRRCPDDVSVVGHNDMPMVDSLQPPLTTVAIPQYEIGQRAASRLLELLSGTAVSQAHDLLPTRLVIRGSTMYRPASR